MRIIFTIIYYQTKNNILPNIPDQWTEFMDICILYNTIYIENNTKQDKVVDDILLDIKGAYDKVNHWINMKSMINYYDDYQFKWIYYLYNNLYYTINVLNYYSEPFKLQIGIIQGCTLSINEFKILMLH